MSKSLKEGLTEENFNFDEYLGKCTFIGLRNIPRDTDEFGEFTEVRKRVYDIKSDGQRTILYISIPAETEAVDIPRDTPVKLVNPLLRFMGERYNPNAIPYIYADNIVPVGQAQTSQLVQPQGQKQNAPMHEDKK